jgi:hypothetical protein
MTPSIVQKLRFPLLALTVGLSAASADIVSVSNNVLLFSTVPYITGSCVNHSVAKGQCQDAEVLAITEVQQYALHAAVHYNYAGTPGSVYDNPDSGTYSLAAGTVVNSYFIHFDPLTNTGNTPPPTDSHISGPIGYSLPQDGVARITFSSEETIAGLQTAPGTLNQGTAAYNSAALEISGLSYANSSGQGPELGTSPTSDWIWIVDPHTIEFRLDANGASVDDFRVLTTLPEPATFWLAGVAALGLAAARKFRRA